MRRLGPLAGSLGLLTPSQSDALAERLDREDRVMAWFQETNLLPAVADPIARAAGSAPTAKPT